MHFHKGCARLQVKGCLRWTLREIDKAVPPELDIHCIVDNYAIHSHPKIKAWLLARPRWHMHFIPTYSSWLNQVERIFALITLS